MGWGRPAPLRCELNLLGRPCGAGWVNKDVISAPSKMLLITDICTKSTFGWIMVFNRQNKIDFCTVWWIFVLFCRQKNLGALSQIQSKCLGPHHFHDILILDLSPGQESSQHVLLLQVLHCVFCLHSSCNPHWNQLVGMVVEPRWVASCLVNVILNLYYWPVASLCLKIIFTMCTD